ncbi:hypothetical protein ACSMXN_07215 [Jatrophihabitans sp. DSM 45814]
MSLDDDEDEDWRDLLSLGPAAGVAPLIALAATGLRKLDDLFGSRTHEPLDWDCVQLVHIDDVRSWTVFPRCQDVDGLSYGEYRVGAKEFANRRKRVAPLLRAERTLSKLNSPGPVIYHTEYVDVPRSAFRRPVRLKLAHERLAGTWLESDHGELEISTDGDYLVITSGWTRQSVAVRSIGPSPIVHADEIAGLEQALAEASDEQRQQIAALRASRFGHPVLFVSHRWESDDHPDPSGQQLRRLSELSDCWLIYDYTSFPQVPRTTTEEAQFQLILDSMREIIRNVVVLASPDYLTRGWLVFEYLVASLGHYIVCDEVHNADFVNLRDWVSTQAPLPTNLWRDSWESQLTNYKNEMVLAAANQLLPLYGQAEFRSEHDATKVTELLVGLLKQALQPRKEHQEGLGEWKSVSWTDEDLEKAFRGEIEIPRNISLPVKPFQTRVPASLSDAVANKYKVNRMTAKELANPLAVFTRLKWGRR